MEKFLAEILINPLACTTFSECIEKITSFILWIGIAIFPIIIIIAGFLFITSGGDPEKVRTAKRIIFWSFIGLIIVLSGKGIVAVIGQLPGIGPGPGCTPDDCNGKCPPGCTVAQDPDCGCRGGNGCCGIGCNHTTDPDCPITGGLTQEELTKLGDIDNSVPEGTPGVPDCKINMADIVYLVNFLGSKPGDPNWNPNADLNKDNVVDDCDLSIPSKITLWVDCGDPLNQALLTKLGDIDNSVPEGTPGVPDCKINMADIAYLVNFLGSKPGDPNWNPNADLNKDNVVDDCDLSIPSKITLFWECRE
jgi:hypothetical protein